MTTRVTKSIPQSTNATFAWNNIGLAPKANEISSQTVNLDDTTSASLESVEAWCYTCLNENVETPGSIEHNEIMYCAEHNPVKPPVVITVPEGVQSLCKEGDM